MLPYPDMNFTAFDILTAEEMNQLVANIEALSDGSGLAPSSVTADKLNAASHYPFRVSRNASASTGAGSYAVVAFDTEQYDVGNNVSSGVFTAPVDGYYEFRWCVTASMSSGASETYSSALHIDGSIYTRGNLVSSPGASGFNWGSGGSDVAYMTTGQTADIRASGSQARLLGLGASATWFSGNLKYS